jgi:chromosome segregation ATPase
MKAQAAPMTDLAEMKAFLQDLWDQRGEVEHKLNSVRLKKAELEAKAKPFLAPHESGDKSATAKLHVIAGEKQEAVWTEESLLKAYASLDSQIVPLQAAVNQRKRELDAEERQRDFVAAKDVVAAWRDKLLALHAEATQTAAELSLAMGDLNQFGHDGAAANEELIFKSALNNPVHALQMAGWTVPQSGAYRRELTIRGMIPPAKPVSVPSGVTQFEQGQGPGDGWNRNFRPRS